MNRNLTPPALLTIDDVAAQLSVSKPTVKRMLADGTLPSVKLGRCRRVRPEDVLDIIQRGWGGRR